MRFAFIQTGFDRLGDDFELLTRGGAIDVDGDEHGPVATLFEPCGQLAAGGGFTGALQASHENHRRWLGGELEAGGIAAQHLDQLVTDDLDDLLGRGESGKHFSANGFGADMFDELVDDVEVNVRFEHGGADLFERFLDVFFSERALPAEDFEGSLQFFCKVLKHRSDLQGSVVSGSGQRQGWSWVSWVAALARLSAS